MSWVGPAAALLGIGWYFAFCILIGVVGGRWLDGVFGTAPFLMLTGILVGLATALVGGYRMLVRALHLGETKEHSGPP